MAEFVERAPGEEVELSAVKADGDHRESLTDTARAVYEYIFGGAKADISNPNYKWGKDRMPAGYLPRVFDAYATDAYKLASQPGSLERIKNPDHTPALQYRFDESQDVETAWPDIPPEGKHHAGGGHWYTMDIDNPPSEDDVRRDRKFLRRRLVREARKQARGGMALPEAGADSNPEASPGTLGDTALSDTVVVDFDTGRASTDETLQTAVNAGGVTLKALIGRQRPPTV